MRVTYRRQRKLDPLASPQSVQSIIDQLRAALPEIIPHRDKDLVRMLRAVRHIHRYPASDTKRVRLSPWKHEDLLKVSAGLIDILERETHSHISLASIVDHYLRLLNFPSDLLQALSVGVINLFEAEQLVRVVAERLGIHRRPSGHVLICSQLIYRSSYRAK